MDETMMAMMGIAGFGKQKKQKQLDPNRFDKNKRTEVRCSPGVYLRSAHPTGVVHNRSRRHRHL